MTLSSSLAAPAECLCRILRHIRAAPVSQGQQPHRIRIASFGGLGHPANGLLAILLDRFAAERQRGQNEHRVTGSALGGFLVQGDGPFRIGFDLGPRLVHGGEADHRRNLAAIGALSKRFLRLEGPLFGRPFIGGIRPAEFEAPRQKDHAARVAVLGGGAEIPHGLPPVAGNRFPLQRQEP